MLSVYWLIPQKVVLKKNEVLSAYVYTVKQILSLFRHLEVQFRYCVNRILGVYTIVLISHI